MMCSGSNKGFALFYVIVLLVCGTLLAYTAFSRFLYQYKYSTIDKELKTASSYATNAMTDIMRQFSQDAYGDHYSDAAVQRSAATFENGFSEVNINADETDHTLCIEAKGKFGSDITNPKRSKTLSAVIKFISDMTSYGTYLNQDFTTSGSGTVYSGKIWINGDWNITGSNVSCVGGPVFVKDDISGTLTIDGDLYYGGSKGSNISVSGNSYNHFPIGDYPSIDTEYYETYYNVKYTDSDELSNEDSWWPDYWTKYVRLDFNADGTITVNGGASPTITIPTSGLIIYGEDANIRVSGIVHGRVTVMADIIKVRNTIVYANGTHYADVEDSFAALAKNKMYFRSSIDQIAHGVYFLDGTSYIYAKGSGGDLEIHGTRNRPISSNNVNSVTLEYDPYLNEFPPPGLPEKPKIVNWSLK